MPKGPIRSALPDGPRRPASQILPVCGEFAKIIVAYGHHRAAVRSAERCPGGMAQPREVSGVRARARGWGREASRLPLSQGGFWRCIRNKRGLPFRVKMSERCISLKSIPLARKPGDGAKNLGMALAMCQKEKGLEIKCEDLAKIDVTENDRVSPTADGQGREKKRGKN